MEITNKLGLPDPIVNAIKNSNHKGGDYSASGLQKSVRQHWLTKRHYSKMSEDAGDMIWAIFGTAVHNVLEKGAGKNDLPEEYFSTDFDGKSFTGTCDLWSDKTVTDYKTTSVWSVIYKSSYADYEKQLNNYAYLYRINGFPVERLQIVALLKDHSKRDAKQKEGYPSHPVQVIDIPLWTEVEQYTYIKNQIDNFEKYAVVDDDYLPCCTKSDMWQDDDKFAVMKKGNKRAVRVLSSEDEAKQFISDKNLDDKHYIETRIAEPRKCQDYCSCAAFCNQYQNKLKG